MIVDNKTRIQRQSNIERVQMVDQRARNHEYRRVPRHLVEGLVFSVDTQDEKVLLRPTFPSSAARADRCWIVKDSVPRSAAAAKQFLTV